jgi:hypothetical protein
MGDSCQVLIVTFLKPSLDGYLFLSKRLITCIFFLVRWKVLPRENFSIRIKFVCKILVVLINVSK